MGQDDDVYVKGILSKLLQGVGLGKSPPDSWSFRLGIFTGKCFLISTNPTNFFLIYFLDVLHFTNDIKKICEYCLQHNTER